MALQTILGAGGAIGSALAKELHNYTDEIRLVSRTPEKVNPNDQLFPADLTDAQQVDKAIEGSSVVYLVVGFEYVTKIWQQKWPALMQHVIDACKKHNARLVFFDNVYMYDRDYLSAMTEETPIRPTSKKGEVRTQVVQMLMSEIKSGNINALIARSADFAGTRNSILVEMVYKNLKNGKSANWFADAGKLHSFTFVDDAAKGTALLGNTPDAYGQVWHLPTHKNTLTGQQWVELFANELNVKPKLMMIPVWMLGLMGLFVPILKELKEMVYQYDRDYVFDSSKFDKRFNLIPTTPKAAVKAIVETM